VTVDCAAADAIDADALCAAATDAGTDVATALALAARVGTRLPQPGAGNTLARWRLLLAAAHGGLTAARILEAHSDALAILAEAGEPAPRGTWGVFAAEADGCRLDAARDGSNGDVRLDGTKPWCSLGGALDSALVTAHTPGGRQLFAVDLHNSGVTADPPGAWVARGLATVTSGPVHFAAVRGRPVGDPGWYLSRRGFAWGGMGVAACWLGGALGLRDALVEHSSGRDGELNALHVGIVDRDLHAAQAVLDAAAADVDAGRAAGSHGAVLALRVRSVVARAVEAVLQQVGHALGPGPLAFDELYARRVADLGLYVRQHHGERDLAALGQAVLAGERRAEL